MQRTSTQSHLDGLSDQELIAATKNGDARAFGSLVRRHQQAAVRIAAVALGSADGAEDVTQDAFVKVHRSIGRFRQDQPFEPWLYRIVTNTARNRIRTESRQRKLRLRSAALAVVDDSGPAETAAHLADRHRLLDAINRLPTADRLVLTYRWYAELSEAEIATAMDCRRGTVKSRLNRAMNRLRAELEDA